MSLIFAKCCGTCQWFEMVSDTELCWSCCTRDDEVDAPTTVIMVCESYSMSNEYEEVEVTR